MALDDNTTLGLAIEQIREACACTRDGARRIDGMAGSGPRGATAEDAERLEHPRRRAWQASKELGAIRRELSELRQRTQNPPP
ncbi:MAG TPA: hypothetical protein VE777_03415 [Gaiellales bacterium]|nr:hypothetical protein [Gaiellales bacterium]